VNNFLHNSTNNRSLTPSTFYGRAHTAYKPLPPITRIPTTTTHSHNSHYSHYNKINLYDKKPSLIVKTPRRCSQQTHTGNPSLEFTLTPSHFYHSTTTRRVKILPITLSEGTPPLPLHPLTINKTHNRLSCLLSPVIYMLILATTTILFYRSFLQLTPLTQHNVTAFCFQHLLPPSHAFSYTETTTLLPIHFVPQRTFHTLYAHTPITALLNTLQHRGPLDEHSVRHTHITPFPEGCSNHMGCLYAPLLLLLFEYHNYYPP
jgi:hypothetical protein